MRIPSVILIGAGALSLGACASHQMMGVTPTGAHYAAGDKHQQAGCTNTGPYYAQGYDIPICHTTTDASLWPH